MNYLKREIVEKHFGNTEKPFVICARQTVKQAHLMKMI